MFHSRICNMKIVLALASVLAVAIAQRFSLAEEDEWSSFKGKYAKKYETAEIEHARKTIFHQNKRTIEDHNRRFETGETTYRLGINKFGDMLSHEVSAMFKGLTMVKGLTMSTLDETEFESFEHIDEVSLPKHVDWRTKHIVTPVKNQGECGSCWAFSATGALEGQHALKTKRLVSLSEQNLVDCSGAEGNEGCNGGWPYEAFVYIKRNKGIDTEKSYPYTGTNGTCAFSKKHIGATDKGYKAIKYGSETALRKAVAKVGPISVGIDASFKSFHLYESGIYKQTNCSTTDLDHAVLVVGYGTHKGSSYWLVKNSWGTDWGINGYIWMARNDNNMCGIASQATYPIV